MAEVVLAKGKQGTAATGPYTSQRGKQEENQASAIVCICPVWGLDRWVLTVAVPSTSHGVRVTLTFS